MGISGLLPLLKSIHRHTELKKFAGETLGVDGYGWLHRGAVACAIELAQGKPTRKYVDFAMHRVRMMKHFGITPYMVFDGDFLPSKAGTEASRAKRREESRKTGLELLKAGKTSQAHLELQKAIDVTPEMARHLIEELKRAGVPYVVAPYEADAQLVYLERRGLIGGILSEDSDLLVFGAKRLLTKLDQHGQCVEINRKDFCAVREISLTGWTDREFRQMAIFSGCDYLEGINKMGLKTAYRMIRKYKTPEKVVRMLQFEGKHQVGADYLAQFRQAELTFLHQRVFCPEKRELVYLTEPDPSVNIDTVPFIGAAVDVEFARAVAAGDVNPITKEVIHIAALPEKRRHSQSVAPAAASAPAPRQPPLGKPIDQYFKGHRRIPLGEMEPNCFVVKPRQAGDAVPANPVPRVFPLPRPYLDDETVASRSSRPYTTTNSRTLRRQTEPISNMLGFGVSDDNTHSGSSRRRTTGSISSISGPQDSGTSMRPPKKARLCEDLPTAAEEEVTDQTHTDGKSKYFGKPAASKPADSFLMSDDSIETALLSLPDSDSWQAPKSAKMKVQVFEDLSPSVDEQPAVEGDDIIPPPTSNIEVPASSPPPEESSTSSVPGILAETPLRSSLRQFSYAPGQPAAPPSSSSSSSIRGGTRMVHGLPTPASSLQQSTASAKRRTSQILAETPMPTPLQRIGAQALRRNKAARRSSPVQPQCQQPASPEDRRDHKEKRRSFTTFPVNPCFVPLPKVDVKEVEALNRPSACGGSEDQIVPDSDGENDPERAGGAGEEEDENDGDENNASRPGRRLDLSRFLFT